MPENSMDEMSLNQGKTFVWHEVYAPDAQASVDFYTKCLDFGSTEMPMDENFTYRMLTRNGQPVCGVLSTTDMKMDGVPPHWATYVSVDDVDARLETCKANGATLVAGPMDVPNVGRMCLIQDPQGAHIWLFKSAS
jgi:predicted enzyme related to lactoylglutathione lyase